MAKAKIEKEEKEESEKKIKMLKTGSIKGQGFLYKDFEYTLEAKLANSLIAESAAVEM